MALIMSFAVLTVKAQTDTMNQQSQGQQEKKVSCAKIDNSTLACFSENVDLNKDNKIDADEWNNADITDKGILELENIYEENEVFESDGKYRYDDLYIPSDTSSMNKEKELLDDEDDGAFN